MNRIIRLLTGPSGTGKSARLHAYAADLVGPVWLIVPSVRHADEIAALEHVIVLPFHLAALKLVDLQPHEELLSEPKQRLVLQHVLGGMKFEALKPLVVNPGFIATVFSFVSELRGLGVDAEQFAQHLGQLEGSPSRRRVDEEVIRIVRAYEQALPQHGFLDRALVYQRAAQQADGRASRRKPDLDARKHVGLTPRRSPKTLIVDGFSALTPPQWAVLRQLGAHIDELWITATPPQTPAEHSQVIDQFIAEIHQSFGAVEEELLSASDDRRPVGVAHLSQSLFVEGSEPTDKTAGLMLIEAPGSVGECRLVARAVKRLLLDGTPAGDILVTARSLANYGDLLAETFDDFGIPVAIEQRVLFARCPAIAALLKAASLLDVDWRFADLASLLRSSWFKPAWPEFVADPEVALVADLLLRDLGEPRGRDAYLNAARHWSKQAHPEQPLEDEDAEGRAWAERHARAKRCLPFLEHLFTGWDGAPPKATLADHVAWLRQLADNLGFSLDAPILQRWWSELDELVKLDDKLTPNRLWPRAHFLNQIATLANISGIDVPSAPAGVRIVPADHAAGLTYDHLFLLDLGEGGFPAIGTPARLYSESERQELRAIGLDLAVAAEQLPAEMHLFQRLLSRAGKSITLSYPALDEKGQEQLPGAFLREMLRLVPNVPRERRQMLTDGLATDSPLSLAEYRVRYALASGGTTSCLDNQLIEHLDAVQHLVKQRFRTSEFGRYDGILSDAADVATTFGPNKRFSATGLERYIACPFQFFAREVLKLSALDEPTDEIEITQRGSAFHRALARLEHHNDATDDVGERLAKELHRAVHEYVDRSASPTTRVLWQLELERLQRSARRYTDQWAGYRERWQPAGRPSFHKAEWKYNTSIEHEEIAFQLHGSIDRVDIVEGSDGSRGAIVIDYKTGRSNHYTGGPVANLERLQLAVYALAAEELLSGTAPRGLLYWLPTDTGAKQVWPKKPLDWADGAGWRAYRGRLVVWLADIIRRIRSGAFPVQPRTDETCNHCEYHRLCRIAQSRRSSKHWPFELPLVEDAADE